MATANCYLSCFARKMTQKKHQKRVPLRLRPTSLRRTSPVPAGGCARIRRRSLVGSRSKSSRSLFAEDEFFDGSSLTEEPFFFFEKTGFRMFHIRLRIFLLSPKLGRRHSFWPWLQEATVLAISSSLKSWFKSSSDGEDGGKQLCFFQRTVCLFLF